MTIHADFSMSPSGPTVATAAPFELVGHAFVAGVRSLDAVEEAVRACEEVRAGRLPRHQGSSEFYAWEVTPGGVRFTDEYEGSPGQSCDISFDDYEGLLRRWHDHVLRAAEEEWSGATTPEILLTRLWRKGSPRKLRLFACHCARRLWPSLVDGRSRRMVELAEEYAEGRLGAEVLLEGLLQSRAVAERWPWPARTQGRPPDADARLALARRVSAHVAYATAITDVEVVAPVVPSMASVWWPRVPGLAMRLNQVNDMLRGRFATPHDLAAWVAAISTQMAEYYLGQDRDDQAGIERVHRCQRELADLLRELFGNPLRLATVRPEWLAGRDGAARKIAGAIYSSRRFADLPILADALEEAGCEDAEILGHLRSPGPHVRGCWVLDRLLGRQ